MKRGIVYTTNLHSLCAIKLIKAINRMGETSSVRMRFSVRNPSAERGKLVSNNLGRWEVKYARGGET